MVEEAEAAEYSDLSEWVLATEDSFDEADFLEIKANYANKDE